MLFMSASLLGHRAAENLIQGKNGSFEIQFFPKDNMDNQLQNKTLIFIMLKDNKYYVLEKNESNTKYPELYIIQEDQVKIAKLHKIQ